LSLREQIRKVAFETGNGDLTVGHSFHELVYALVEIAFVERWDETHANPLRRAARLLRDQGEVNVNEPAVDW
jgi:hypothetical protein